MEYFFNFEKIAYLRDKKPAGCILCLLRDGDPYVRDTIIHKTEDTAVSMNLYPYNPGHILIFPLRHAEDIRELTEKERYSIDCMLNKVLDALDSLYNPRGYNIGYNMGKEAGASIEHIHMHVIPRYPHELGIAELLGGKRVLVEDLEISRKKLCNTLRAGH